MPSIQNWRFQASFAELATHTELKPSIANAIEAIGTGNADSV